MGELRKVEVGLVDLKVLVDAMFEKDVRRRAEIIVLNQPGHADPQVVFEFDRLVGEAEPEARAQVELRYRRLREALESGVHVAQALKAFLHRG